MGIMACLSLRQFERNFTCGVGIAPKMYIRIVRFENAMKVKNGSPEKKAGLILRKNVITLIPPIYSVIQDNLRDFSSGHSYATADQRYGDFPTG